MKAKRRRRAKSSRESAGRRPSGKSKASKVKKLMRHAQKSRKKRQ